MSICADSIRPFGILVHSTDLQKDSLFWQNTLDFHLETNCESFVLLKRDEIHLVLAKRFEQSPLQPEHYVGIEHLALAASNIETELTAVAAKGYSLNTNGGKPHFNPKVWRDGTLFFNFKSPRGELVEFCQRLAQPQSSDKSLSHIGIPSSNYASTAAFYQKLGFECGCKVLNYNDREGNIVCGMFDYAPLCLEIFQFLDAPEYHCVKNSFYGGLIFECTQDIEALNAAMQEEFPGTSEVTDYGDVRYFSAPAPDSSQVYFVKYAVCSNQAFT